MMDEDEIEAMKKLGIPIGFDSTKGKSVAGNDVGAVRKVTKRQPRQYMNRRWICRIAGLFLPEAFTKELPEAFTGLQVCFFLYSIFSSHTVFID